MIISASIEHCDRCGKEIAIDDPMSYKAAHISHLVSKPRIFFKFRDKEACYAVDWTVCSDCMEEFYKWFNECEKPSTDERRTRLIEKMRKNENLGGVTWGKMRRRPFRSSGKCHSGREER